MADVEKWKSLKNNWDIVKEEVDARIREVDSRLRTCAPEDLRTIQAELKAWESLKLFPDQVIERDEA